MSLPLLHISKICFLLARSGLDCGGMPGGKKCKLWMPRQTPDMRTGEGSILGSARCGLDSSSSVFAEVKKKFTTLAILYGTPQFTFLHSWNCYLQSLSSFGFLTKSFSKARSLVKDVGIVP